MDASRSDSADARWTQFAVFEDSNRAHELLELLQAAEVPCRLSFGGGGPDVLGGAALPPRGPDMAPLGMWVVAVVESEEVVAKEIAERLLSWWHESPAPEGDATDEEIEAAFDTPLEADPEFAERLAKERARGEARERLQGVFMLAILVVLLLFVLKSAI